MISTIMEELLRIKIQPNMSEQEKENNKMILYFA